MATPPRQWDSEQEWIAKYRSALEAESAKSQTEHDAGTKFRDAVTNLWQQACARAAKSKSTAAREVAPTKTA